MTIHAIPSGNASGTQASTAPQPRLVRAAHEFEGMMMEELLKPMTEDNGLTGDDTDTDSDSGSGSAGALGDFAAQALGQALSQRGGFGIADQIIRQLSHSGAATPTGSKNGKVTTNLSADTVMEPNK